MRLLTTCFAVDVFAYSVMSNHCHIVLYVEPERVNALSDEDIIRRWKTLWNWRTPDRPINVPATVSEEKLAEWRDRLSDVSWFMRLLNEPMARVANAEDGCKGHFWESRFESIPLLDEAAVLACMTYVDLNPIKAGIAETLDDSNYTSIQQRVQQIDEQNASTPLSSVDNSSRPIRAVEHGAPFLSITNRAYLNLVQETAKSVQGESAAIDHGILDGLNLDKDGWVESATRFLDLFRSAAGSDAAFATFMERTGRRRNQDAGARRTLYSG